MSLRGRARPRRGADAGRNRVVVDRCASRSRSTRSTGSTSQRRPAWVRSCLSTERSTAVGTVERVESPPCQSTEERAIGLLL